MGTIRTTIAVMLAALALTAFRSDAFAQERVARTSTQKSSGKSVSRSSSTTGRSSAARPASRNRQTVSRPAGRAESAARPSTSSGRKPSASTQTRPATRPTARPAAKPADRSVTKPVTKPAARPVTRPSEKPVTRPSDRPSARPATRPSVAPDRRPAQRPAARPSDRPASRPSDRPMQQIRPGHKPDAHRVHPHDRPFVSYSRPAHYWSHHGHCFGHRVRVLPSYAVRYYHHGISYYCYNDIWYRPYGGYYVVCRPPFGTVLAANLIADMAWTAVRYSYYNTVANTYSQINENNEYIAQQNAVIAQNNATIAAQNQTIAMNQQLASQAYELANELGLVQSYAAADSEYFYQDGIFYAKDSKGEYKVIVPPAGALVETLPDDYEMITLKGDEYYKVDDTVYKVTISDGKPYFEVLGQLV